MTEKGDLWSKCAWKQAMFWRPFQISLLQQGHWILKHLHAFKPPLALAAGGRKKLQVATVGDILGTGQSAVVEEEDLWNKCAWKRAMCWELLNLKRLLQRQSFLTNQAFMPPLALAAMGNANLQVALGGNMLAQKNMGQSVVVGECKLWSKCV